MNVNDELRCIVVDDEPLAAELIASYVEKTPELKLSGVFGSAQEAIRIILTGGIDVVFLDINMPQLNGLEFSRILPSECKIIFITAYESYAIQAFKSGALDYLLKPVNYEEFLAASQRAIQWHKLRRRAENSMKNTEFIIVKSDYRLVQLKTDSIQYVEGLKDYVKIITDDDPSGIVTQLSMKSIEKVLPAPYFVRVHRSFIVNMAKIKKFDRHKIEMGSKGIPVGEGYRQAINEYIDSRIVKEDRQPE